MKRKNNVEANNPKKKVLFQKVLIIRKQIDSNPIYASASLLTSSMDFTESNTFCKW